MAVKDIGRGHPCLGHCGDCRGNDSDHPQPPQRSQVLAAVAMSSVAVATITVALTLVMTAAAEATQQQSGHDLGCRHSLGHCGRNLGCRDHGAEPPPWSQSQQPWLVPRSFWSWPLPLLHLMSSP